MNIGESMNTGIERTRKAVNVFKIDQDRRTPAWKSQRLNSQQWRERNTQMEKEKALEQARLRLADYVNLVTVPSKGKDKYVCPHCGSGTGEKGTGAFSINPNTNTFRCFACGINGDTLDLYGIINKIDDFNDKLEGVCNKLNIPLDHDRPLKKREVYGLDWNATIGTDRRPTEQEDMDIQDYLQTELEGQEVPNIEKNKRDLFISESQTPEKVDYTDYILACNKRLQTNHKYLDERGISLELANKFYLGIDTEWSHPKWTGDYAIKNKRECLIIPTNNFCYTARVTTDALNNSNEWQKKNLYKKYKVGKEEGAMFNDTEEDLQKYNAPVFVVEGEIDALSIMEVGGKALGLRSTTNVTKFLEMVKRENTQCLFLIGLDSDEAGTKAQRRLIEGLQELKKRYRAVNINLGYNDTNEALTHDRDALKQAITKEKNNPLTQQEQDDKDAYLEEISHDNLDEFLKEYEQGEGRTYTPTGIQQLDERLHGGLAEGLYCFVGGTSTGKTTLVLQIMDNIARNTDTDVIIFSLEMSKHELIARSLSRLTKEYSYTEGQGMQVAVPIDSIYNMHRKDFTDAEKKALDYAKDKYKTIQKHLYIKEGIGDISFKQVKETVEKHIQYTGHKPIVVIDYFQILSPANERMTDKQANDKNVVELKRLSRDYKIPVVVVSSVGRASYEKEIGEASAKESGAIEYTCDVLLGLQYQGQGKNTGADKFDINQAKRNNPREMELRIIKNRNGEIGTEIPLEYHSKYWYFKEKPICMPFNGTLGAGNTVPRKKKK